VISPQLPIPSPAPRINGYDLLGLDLYYDNWMIRKPEEPGISITASLTRLRPSQWPARRTRLCAVATGAEAAMTRPYLEQPPRSLEQYAAELRPNSPDWRTTFVAWQRRGPPPSCAPGGEIGSDYGGQHFLPSLFPQISPGACSRIAKCWCGRRDSNPHSRAGSRF
jgi:hypothetical protein